MAKTNTRVDEPQDATTQRPSKKRATKKPAKKQRATQTTGEATPSSAPSTAKKRVTKKPTKKRTPKKPAKKQRATSKQENADDATASAPSTVKKRTTKKPTKKSTKKPAKKQRADQTTEEAAATSSALRTTKKRTAKKPAKKAEKPAATEARAETPPKPSEATEQVETTAPADRAQQQVGATGASDQARQKVETPPATDHARKADPGGQTPESAPAEEMQWGRRTKRSSPIGREGRVGVSTPVQPTRRTDAQADAPAVETPAAEPEPKTPPPPRAAQGRTRSDQNDRKTQRPDVVRGRQEVVQSRNDQNDRKTQRPSSNRSRNEKKPDGASRKLAEILAQSWTEDKTRRFLSEGFLSSLSADLVDTGNRASLPDAEALKKPMEMIRKVLADECMVADDVSDLLLLDVVMNALSDRIDVCRLQAESNSLADIDAILELRYKADRRLIEAVNALKNA